jgi:REP element-mobilizing transposase RayT
MTKILRIFFPTLSVKYKNAGFLLFFHFQVGLISSGLLYSGELWSDGYFVRTVREEVITEVTVSI